MRIILLIALCATLLVVGCTATPKTNLNLSATAGPNQPNGLQITTPEEDGTTPQTSLGDTNTQTIPTGKMLYCILQSPELTQEYWFTADSAFIYTRATEGTWNKALINRVQRCAWDDKTRNCGSIAEAGGFEEIYNGWKLMATSLGECSEKTYDPLVFQ